MTNKERYEAAVEEYIADFRRKHLLTRQEVVQNAPKEYPSWFIEPWEELLTIDDIRIDIDGTSGGIIPSKDDMEAWLKDRDLSLMKINYLSWLKMKYLK